MRRTEAEAILEHIIGHSVQSWNARQDAILEATKRRRKLVAAGRCDRVTEEGLHGNQGPVIDPERRRHLVEDLRFRHPVLRRTGAMRHDEAVGLNRLASGHGRRRRNGLGHADMISWSWRGDGLLGAVRVDEHIGDRPEARRAQFQRQSIIHQNEILARLTDRETAILPERTAGAAIINVALAIELGQIVVGGQRAHGAEPVHQFRHHRRFAVANHGDAHLTCLNVSDGMAQIGQEGCAGGNGAAGDADIGQDIGIDKISRHRIDAHDQRLCGHALPHHAGLMHPAIALAVHLAETAAGIDPHFIRLDTGEHIIPVNAERTQGIGGAEQRHLKATWLESRIVQASHFKAARQLTSRLDRKFACI